LVTNKIKFFPVEKILGLGFIIIFFLLLFLLFSFYSFIVFSSFLFSFIFLFYKKISERNFCAAVVKDNDLARRDYSSDDFFVSQKNKNFFGR
jgi:predicted membrane protein